MKNRIKILITLSMLLFMASPMLAQEALKQKPSPLGLVTYKFDDAYVKVTYSRPHLRGREAFKENSELAPLGKVWRTGANEATEITVTKAITMAGVDVPVGTYTLFSIPEEDKWTIILNKDLGQWGTYKYEQEKDFIRFEVPSEKTKDRYEPFTIMFDQSNGEVKMQMMWSDTMVEIPVLFLD
jgi:hypothetical protein